MIPHTVGWPLCHYAALAFRTLWSLVNVGQGSKPMYLYIFIVLFIVYYYCLYVYMYADKGIISVSVNSDSVESTDFLYAVHTVWYTLCKGFFSRQLTHTTLSVVQGCHFYHVSLIKQWNKMQSLPLLLHLKKQTRRKQKHKLWISEDFSSSLVWAILGVSIGGLILIVLGNPIFSVVF